MTDWCLHSSLVDQICTTERTLTTYLCHPVAGLRTGHEKDCRCFPTCPLLQDNNTLNSALLMFPKLVDRSFGGCLELWRVDCEMWMLDNCQTQIKHDLGWVVINREKNVNDKNLYLKMMKIGMLRTRQTFKRFFVLVLGFCPWYLD